MIEFEERFRERLDRRHENRHVFGPTAGHDGIDGKLFGGDDASALSDLCDPGIAEGVDVEDLPVPRLASDFGDAGAAGAEHDFVTGADKLERVDIAPLLEPRVKCLEYLVAPDADPVLS